jgi:hypothetical protein
LRIEESQTPVSDIISSDEILSKLETAIQAFSVTHHKNLTDSVPAVAAILGRKKSALYRWRDRSRPIPKDEEERKMLDSRLQGIIDGKLGPMDTIIKSSGQQFDKFDTTEHPMDSVKLTRFEDELTLILGEFKHGRAGYGQTILKIEELVHGLLGFEALIKKMTEGK